jgi:hypothetical protein
MRKPKDDLEAVRAVVDAIKDFRSDDQQRILRWVAEKVGLLRPFDDAEYARSRIAAPPAKNEHPTLRPPPLDPVGGAVTDIKMFIAAKRPRSGVQFAATVAYYYRFEAPQAERKDTIDKDDLQDVTQRLGRKPLPSPRTTLNNALKLGLLERGPEKATFSLSSLGENLVAKIMPGGKTNWGARANL